MAKNKSVKYVIIAGVCGIVTLALIGFNAYAGGAALPQNGATGDADGAALAEGGVIEIKEKLFIAQTNEVYLNPDDYMGKTIRLEGLFKTEQYEEGEDPYCYVLRYGPGCCGYDGTAGFEVAWMPRAEVPAAETAAYPHEDDWVEVVGTLSSYEEKGNPYLYLRLDSLTVKDSRGAEFVKQ
jgi:uncharacterized membrane protein YcgQ (UPF0703/DUF1980 family)